MKKINLSVAMVAPPFGDTGGPEIVAQNLTDALLELGVSVTLFAPGDWKTRAKHVITLEKSITNMAASDKKDILKLRLESQMRVVESAQKFDLIHFHSQREAANVAKKISKPCVLSFHNKIKEEQFIENVEAGLNIVALSNAQCGGFEVAAMIHNGVPVKSISFSFEKGNYLIFVGRIDDQKGVDIAIEIAKKAGKKLYIFGRVGKTVVRKKFFAEKVEPFLDNEKIVYKGEVSHEQAYEYMRNAEALLFPIRREEVFGMVVAEALACGTPVIGTKTAPLPEILRDSRVAFLSDDIDELVEAAKNTDRFNRMACRKYAEENFDSSVMAEKYLKLYKKILKY